MRMPKSTRGNPESGQSTIMVVLVLGIFLFGAVGLAVDYSNLWFHRQAAQGAADAACQAAGMDMLTAAGGASITSAHFTPGTAHTCTSGDNAVPCVYAALNGYNSAGLTTGAASNLVNMTFPSSVSGVTLPTIPASLGVTYPFVRIDVTDRVPVVFSGLMTGARTADVKASATCGLATVQSPVPILVLDPSSAGSMTISGNPTITIKGGPSQSIQVNSVDSGAVNFNGTKGLVDLSQAGKDGKGGDFGVLGGPSTQPSNITVGTAGKYVSPHPLIPDPYAGVPDPLKPAQSSTYKNPQSVTNGATNDATHDVNCPAAAAKCVRYMPGYYPNGILEGGGSGELVLFGPGLYYLDDAFDLRSKTAVRPSTYNDGSPGYSTAPDGTFFYLNGSKAYVSIGGNSGSVTLPNFPNTALTCDGSAWPSALALDASVLLAPCTGVYGDPAGKARGILFMHSRDVTPKAPGGDSFNYGGQGTMLFAGSIYFHNSTAYTTNLVLNGASGSNTELLGDLVVDQLTMGGNNSINMELNSSILYSVLKVALLK